MLTAADATHLRLAWASRFPERAAYEASIDRYLDKIPQAKRSVDGAERWLREDAQGFDVRAAFLAGHDDPLTENYPQQDFDLDTVSLRKFIAAGDIHDWSELEPVRHAAQCPRCQFGIHAREAADKRAHTLGKQPFPGLADTLLQLYQDRRQRCDDCSLWEDEPAADSCPRSFWHLPDVWLTLHPDATLTDMGTLGPFMRGFLRRQRP